MAFMIQRDIVDVKVRIDGVNVDRDDFTPPFQYKGWMYSSDYNNNYSIFIDLKQDDIIEYLIQSGYVVSNSSFAIDYLDKEND